MYCWEQWSHGWLVALLRNGHRMVYIPQPSNVGPPPTKLNLALLSAPDPHHLPGWVSKIFSLSDVVIIGLPSFWSRN